VRIDLVAQRPHLRRQRFLPCHGKPAFPLAQFVIGEKGDVEKRPSVKQRHAIDEGVADIGPVDWARIAMLDQAVTEEIDAGIDRCGDERQGGAEQKLEEDGPAPEAKECHCHRIGHECPVQHQDQGDRRDRNRVISKESPERTADDELHELVEEPEEERRPPNACGISSLVRQNRLMSSHHARFYPSSPYGCRPPFVAENKPFAESHSPSTPQSAVCRKPNSRFLRACYSRPMTRAFPANPFAWDLCAHE